MAYFFLPVLRIDMTSKPCMMNVKGKQTQQCCKIWYSYKVIAPKGISYTPSGNSEGNNGKGRCSASLLQIPSPPLPLAYQRV
jgi:hypothetical protein